MFVLDQEKTGTIPYATVLVDFPSTGLQDSQDKSTGLVLIRPTDTLSPRDSLHPWVSDLLKLTFENDHRVILDSSVIQTKIL